MPSGSRKAESCQFPDNLAVLSESGSRATLAMSAERLEPELAPAPRNRGNVGFARPHFWWEARAAEIGVGVVVEVHRGVDQHSIPLAGAEQRRIAVTPPRRGVEACPKSCRHDDDIVLAG